MNEPPRLCVEFESSREPIGGTVEVGEVRRPFTGWLGLISALQRALEEAQQSAHE